MADDRTALEELAATYEAPSTIELPPAWRHASPWVGRLRKVKGLKLPQKPGTLFYINVTQRMLRMVFLEDVERGALRIGRNLTTSHTIIDVWPSKSDAHVRRFDRQFSTERIAWGWFSLSSDLINYLKG